MIACLHKYESSNDSDPTTNTNSTSSSNTSTSTTSSIIADFASAKETVLLAVVYFYTVVLGAVAASLGEWQTLLLPSLCPFCSIHHFLYICVTIFYIFLMMNKLDFLELESTNYIR
jgi:hypothetical protein